MATLTTRLLAQASAITPTTLIHIVVTGDTSQSPQGSSYKAELGQLTSLFGGNADLYITGGTYSSGTLDLFDNSGNTITITGFTTPFTGGSSNCITDLYVSNLYGCSPIKVWDNLTLSGSVIDSQGGGYLDLRYGNSDGRFYLGNDNGGYSDTFIQGENGYLEISAYDPAARIAMFTDGGNAGFVLTNDTSFFSTDISLYTDTTSIVSTPNNYIGLGSGNSLEITNDNVWIKSNEAFNITTNPHSGVGLGASSDFLIATVTGTSYTTNTLRETNPSILSSQYSTIQMGIKNSVILGGYNLNATQDNTAYVDNLNINTIGSGTSVINLGLDSSGNVVTGTTGGGGVSIDPYFTEPSATSITWDVSGNSTNYQTVLTANTTLTLTNVRNGDYGTIILQQDGVGGRTLTFGTVNGGATTHRVVNGGGGTPTLTSNIGAIDILTFTYNGSVMYWTVGNDYN